MSSQRPKKDSNLESFLHSEHTVTIEKMAIGGDGVARIELPDQKKLVVFIPWSAPQDILKIRITQIEKTFVFGQILEIIKPSPHRVQPPCPVAGVCGGCLWQHISESEQIHQKEELLKELFKKFVPDLSYQLLPTVTTEHSFEYRNRIQIKHFKNQIGYFKPASHDIVNINDCVIAEPLIRQELKTLHEKLGATDKLKKYELYINQEQKLVRHEIGNRGEGLAFSQVNRFINQKLIDKTVGAIESIRPEFLTELYAGSGNFTFPIAEKLISHNKHTKIESVELNETLTRHAVENIKKLKLNKNILFFTSKVETFVNRKSISSECVLLDPPRSGCEPSVMKDLALARPQHIFYISCHPTQLARDIALLNQKARYNVKELQIFDMFPQTDHFETFCWLERG